MNEVNSMKTKSFKLNSHGNTLRGIIFKKENNIPSKTVIISHGFASNMLITLPYAKPFIDAGYVVIMFDFCRSGSGISGGKSVEMSVLTQKDNLLDVLEYARTLDFVDNEHITLCGCSQGGFVSALAGAEKEDEIERMILYYPALCIPDDSRRGCVIGTKIDPDNVPDHFFGVFVKLGKKYVETAKSLDPYEQICSFSKPVFIVHGIEDKLVNIDYSRKAEKLYKHCKLTEIHGDHGFIVKGLSASKKVTAAYLKSI